MNETPDIPGANEVLAWFGYWPTFHDAEVVSITLDRAGGSQVVIHAFHRTSDVGPRGYYVLVKHAMVTFSFDGFPFDEDGNTNTRIEFFNHQNVLSSARIEKTSMGHVLELDGIFGVDASISCRHLRVKIEPRNSNDGE